MKYLIGVLCLFASYAHSADLLVHVGTSTAFEEGDVVNVFNSDQIQYILAYRHVHPKSMRRVGQRIVPGELLETYLENTKQYKFERIDINAVRHTNLWTMDIDTIATTPNGNGEFMRVSQYVNDRVKNHDNLIFGDVGAEYWFGGYTTVTPTRVDAIWDDIEARTPAVRPTEFPFTEPEKRRFMVLRTDDLTKAEIETLEEGLYDNLDRDAEGRNLIRRRRFKINFNNLNLTAQERGRIRNPAQNKDFRGTNQGDITNLMRDDQATR